MAVANGKRQYDFLSSVVDAALLAQKVFLSQHVIKALNFHAITCLHTNPGEYRPCAVIVGNHRPPEHHAVQALMDDFVNTVNRYWENTDAITLSAFVLWRLNFIHPFINGNGRTARAAAYFVLCLKSGYLLPGTPTLPELIMRDRADYVAALQHIDQSLTKGAIDLTPLQQLLQKLVQEQLASAPQAAAATPPQAPPPSP